MGECMSKPAAVPPNPNDNNGGGRGGAAGGARGAHGGRGAEIQKIGGRTDNNNNKNNTNNVNKSKSNSPLSSTRSEMQLTSHMIRERNADVWDYYEEIRRLGEGSIGCVSLVKRKKGTEGGSAYTRGRRRRMRMTGFHYLNFIKMGMFGCDCMASSRGGGAQQQQQNAHLKKTHKKSSKSTKSTSKFKSFTRSTTKSTNAKEKNNTTNPPPTSLHTEEYALKSIQLRLVQKQYLDELRNEIIILRSLDHPNIVKAYEVYETRQNIYVLMEYCSGGDLYARAPYTEWEAVGLVRQLVSAIGHMHKNGVVHRDIKFENIMFESKDDPMAKIKVLDFGLSRKFLPGMSQIMTEGVGTVYTMAPQVFQGLYTSKADLWSIGVITFILLSQQKPFKGKTRSQVVHNIKKCRYNFNAPGWANISKEAKRFVSALLVLNPAQRLSADQALEHPWLKMKKSDFPSSSVSEGIDRDSSVRASLMMNVKDNILSYASMSELRRIAAVIVAHKSSAAEILDMREAFDKYDTKKDGVISLDEFKSALEEFNYTDEELNDMFSQMDVNCNGVILYTEFIAATLELHGRVEEKRLAEAFDLMDDDDSGYISKENLIKLLGKDVPPDRIDRLIEQADFDGDGMISFEDFLTMFRIDNAETTKEEVGAVESSASSSHTE